MKKYRWGILAPGKMSGKFTRALKLLDRAELYAVGSRDLSRARQFADEHGFRKAYGSYEELAADPGVDIIYIASPHSYHHDHALLCIRSGKPVLLEKAFALNSREAEEILNEAAKRTSKQRKSSAAGQQEKLSTSMHDLDSRLLSVRPTGNSALNLEAVHFWISAYILFSMLYGLWAYLTRLLRVQLFHQPDPKSR